MSAKGQGQTSTGQSALEQDQNRLGKIRLESRKNIKSDNQVNNSWVNVMNI